MNQRKKDEIMAVKTLGVVDLGSHSVHLEIFNLRGKREPLSVYSKSQLSHLGRTVGKEGRIPSPLLHHLQAAIAKCLQKAKKKGADAILIGATAGFRKASNGKEVIGKLERYFHLPMHLLDPDRESELGFIGIQQELRPGVNQLFVDCGGGSTEVSLTRGQRRGSHVTLPLGSSLLSLKIQNDPPEATDIVRLMLPWMEHFSSLPETLQPSEALVSGGSIADLMTLSTDDVPTTVTLAHLNKAIRLVLRKQAKKIAKKHDMELEDAGNLLPAALILSSILTHYRLNRAAYTPKSVRDGMAREYQVRGDGWWKGYR
jgi:exopolyphosphatase / guanosine-5'-triphosphate,3'-diphosphate pyrophosphatase